MGLNEFRISQNKESDSARRNASNAIGLTKYVDKIGDQYAAAINKAKTLQVYVGPLVANLQSITNEKKWNNWTQQKVNGIIDLGTDAERYWLSIEDLTFNIQIKNTFVDAGIDTVFNKFNEFIGNSKLESNIDAVSTGLEFARAVRDGINDDSYQGSTFIPKYKNIKAWDGTEPIQYKFPAVTFRYGQYGKYNSLEEVVLPTMALVSSFLPEEDPDNKGRWIGPIPTLPATYVSVMRQLMQIMPDKMAGMKDAVLSKFNNTGNNTADTSGSGDNTNNSFISKIKGVASNASNLASNALDTAIAFKDSVYQIFDEVNEGLLKKQYNKLAYIQVANAVMGPLYVSSLSPTFDFSNVDQNGYPTKASIQFEGLSTPMLATRDHLDIFGLTSSNGPYSLNMKE